MKLKTKFIVPTMLLILAGMSCNSWLTYRYSTDSLKELTLQKARTNLGSLLSLVELWIRDIGNETATLAATPSLVDSLVQAGNNDTAAAQTKALLQDSFSRHPTLDNLFLIDAKGTVVAATNPSLQGKNLGQREYFQRALRGETFISPPLFSVDKGEAVFVIAVPVKNGPNVVGVLTAGVLIGKFTRDFVTPINSEAGYAFIAAPDGTVLAHPDNKLVGKYNLLQETDFGRQMVGQPNGRLETVSLGVPKLILYETAKATGWIIGMAVDTEKAFASARQLGWIILGLSGLLALVLGLGIWGILSVNVLRPVGGLVTAADAIAGGDLDTALDSSRRDEIGSLQRAMGQMVATLKAKIREAQDQGALAASETERARTAMDQAMLARQQADAARQEGMLQAAGQLQDVVGAIATASESISAQIEQSSRGSEEQSLRVAATATAMEQMRATVLEVARNASQAAAIADAARHKASEGSRVVEDVIRGIGQVQSQALATKDDMAALGRQAEGIGAVLGVISDIADQTNLLALNAAIEAARAGEAGRGFAVVADEVRKLAEKTMTATKEVGQAIAGIQQGTRKNSDNVTQAARGIGEATEMAGRSGQALGAIVSLVDQTTDQVRAIATASEEQSAASEEINRSIADVNRIASESAEGLRRSAQAVQELAAQTQVLRELIETMRTASAGAPAALAPGREEPGALLQATSRPRA